MDVKTHSAGEAFQYKTRIQKKGKTFNVEVSKLCLLGEMITMYLVYTFFFDIFKTVEIVDYLFTLLSLLKKKIPKNNYILVFSA